jgi:hypothetical protein
VVAVVVVVITLKHEVAQAVAHCLADLQSPAARVVNRILCLVIHHPQVELVDHQTVLLVVVEHFLQLMAELAVTMAQAMVQEAAAGKASLQQEIQVPAVLL